MAITSATWWDAACDVCGDQIAENDYGGYDLAQSREEAQEFVTDRDGEIRDGKVICSVCIDDEAAEEAQDVS